MSDTFRVREILADCQLLNGEEIDTEYLTLHGVTCGTVYLHPSRLKEYAPEIDILLDDLSDSFGGERGAPLRWACLDKAGNQWSSGPEVPEILLLLGMGIGRVECLTPEEQRKSRDQWSVDYRILAEPKD